MSIVITWNEQRQREVLQDHLARRKHAQLASVFRGWRRVYKAVHTHNLSTQARHLDIWRHALLAKRHDELIMVKIQQNSRVLRLRGAVRCLRAFADRHRLYKRHNRRAQRMNKRRVLGMCFDRWLKQYDAIAHSQRVTELQQARDRAVLASRAFTAWADHTRKTRQLKTLEMECKALLIRRSQARVMQRWRAALPERHNIRNFVFFQWRVLLFIQRNRKRRGVLAWRKLVHNRKHKVRTHRERMVTQVVTRVFRSWRDWASSRVQRRLLGYEEAYKLSQYIMFRSWLRLTRDRMATHAHVLTMRRNRARRRVKASLQLWMKFVQRKKQEKKRIQARGRRAMLEAIGVWRRWSFHHAERRLQSTQVESPFSIHIISIICFTFKQPNSSLFKKFCYVITSLIFSLTVLFRPSMWLRSACCSEHGCCGNISSIVAYPRGASCLRPTNC